MSTAPTLHPDPEHVADACVAVANVNHYLVQLAPVPLDVARAAEQVLITRENAGEIAEEVADLAFFVLRTATFPR
jgi:hypothetical protein